MNNRIKIEFIYMLTYPIWILTETICSPYFCSPQTNFSLCQVIPSQIFPVCNFSSVCFHYILCLPLCLHIIFFFSPLSPYLFPLVHFISSLRCLFVSLFVHCSCVPSLLYSPLPPFTVFLKDSQWNWGKTSKREIVQRGFLTLTCYLIFRMKQGH